MKGFFAIRGLCLLKIGGTEFSKSEVALFCFLGHRANPNLTDCRPEKLHLHGFGLLEPLGTLICEFGYSKLL